MLCVCRSCCHYRQTTASPWDPAGEKRRASLSSVSSMTSSEFDPAQHPLPKRSVKKEFEARRKHPVWEKTPYKKRRSRTRSHSTHKRYDKRSRSRSHSPSRGYDKHRGRSSLHPWQRSDYIRSRNDSSVDYNKQKSDKLEEFKRLSNAIENDMERIFKQHEKNPEKHPQYNEEWKQFWNRRYKELQAEGKDATNYDFKPEWIEFWNKRMLELHSTDIKTKKDALRKRLGLPEEPNPISFKITGGRKKSSHKEDSKDSKPVPLASVPDQDPDIIIIEDKDEDTISSKRSHSPWESEPGSRPNSRRSRERSREISRDKSKERVLASRDRSRERSHRSHDRSRSRSRDRWHPRSREKEYHRDLPPHEKAYYRDVHRKHAVPEYLKPPRAMRDVTRHPVLSPPLRKPELPEPELDDEEVNIVGVLRLLTALEEKLGSLGPKIIDLLGKALAMEKSEANSSETLIDNEVNCVLFETVKEKLKGQLLAGLVDYNQEKAFKKAIKKIASLIHFASERKKEKEKEKQVDPIKVPGVGTVDKAAIAKQIATALVLQGKTDVSQAELEQLINAVAMASNIPDISYCCEICGVEGLTEDELRTHTNTAHIEGHASCPFCQLSAVSPAELLLHVNQAHLDYLTPESEVNMSFIDDASPGRQNVAGIFAYTDWVNHQKWGNTHWKRYCLLKSYGLIKHIVFQMLHMVSNSGPYLILYSGHDHTLEQLSTALGLQNDPLLLRYGARIVIEAYHDNREPQNGANDVYFRILSNGKDVTRQVSFCKDIVNIQQRISLCKIEDIVRFIHDDYFSSLNFTNFKDSCAMRNNF